MTCIFCGTIAQLKEKVKDELFFKSLEEEFKAKYGKPSDSEKKSWVNSLPALCEVIDEEKFDTLQVLIEYQMPIGAERADIVLLGGTDNSPKVCVIELKQWAKVNVSKASRDILVPGLADTQQHPSIQVRNYRGKLRLFHSLGDRFDFLCAVYLHNMSLQEKDNFVSEFPEAWTSEAPLFCGEDSSKLSSFIEKNLLPINLNPNTLFSFDEAGYDQTQHLFEIIKQHATDIANRAVDVLAESGVGLTAEQEKLVDEVLASAINKEEKVFLVRGGPGSGKTLVAVTLLLRAAQQGLKCILAIRNNRLRAILEKCFDIAYPGASGSMLYFEAYGRGIGEEAFRATFDLVICDEAQRMRKKSMPITFGRAPVSAIFLDEGQRLNPREDGVIGEFSEASILVDKALEYRELSAAIRCRGGQPYHDWLERLLVSPTSKDLSLTNQNWLKSYMFEVCESVTQLIGKLRVLHNDTGQRVAMVASFTESPGSMENVNHPDNLRIGYPLTSGWDYYYNSDLYIRWLMKPSEYVSFWMNKKSNNLDRVASIYGAQGFESDFVGVIWGRDLVYRSGEWQLGDPEHCFDWIDGLVSKKSPRSWKTGDALDLLINRYRIFLTRGIRGTFVFCEDAETREFLKGL